MDGNRKQRLLIITRGLNVGGVETHVYHLAKYLRDDFEIRLAVQAGGMMADRIRDELGLDISIVRGGYATRLLGFLKLCRWADVVNVNGLGIGSMAAQLSGRYVVETIHNCNRNVKGLNRFHTAVLYRMADRRITYSATVAVFTHKYFWVDGEIGLFRHCVENPGALANPHGPFTVGFVGRFTKQRMVDVMADGFRAFLRLVPDALLVAIGSGEMEDELQPSPNIVVFAPLYGENLRAVMRSFDCFVYLTDKVAGMPIAPLEAMALGIPVISTETALSPEMMGPADHLALKVVPTREGVALALMGLYLRHENARAKGYPEMSDAVLRYHNPEQFCNRMAKYLRFE